MTALSLPMPCFESRLRSSEFIRRMGLASFLSELFEHGRVRIDEPTPTATGLRPPAAEDRAAAEVILRERDATVRLDFPGDAPDFDPNLALWGAEQFYRACQFTVYRDVPAPVVVAILSAPCPTAPLAAQHYHLDLTFRFLPDLMRLARTAAENDPLCEQLKDWANRWPLSSVGMAGVEPDANEPAWEDAGLLRLYVDRVIAARDLSRINNPRVRRALRAALGFYDRLAPQLAEALAKHDLALAAPEAETL
jgi:hypothetical protein